MGNSQSYDLSQESAKSIQEKQDIVPSNEILDETKVTKVTSSNHTTVPNVEVSEHLLTCCEQIFILKLEFKFKSLDLNFEIRILEL